MAMKLLKARAVPSQAALKEIQLKVWLDDTKFEADGETPDDFWCRDFTWTYTPSQDGTKAQFLVKVKAETKLICQADLAKLKANTSDAAGDVITGEGLEL